MPDPRRNPVPAARHQHIALRLTRRDAREGLRELAARANAQLGEDLAEVVLGCARADEQAGCDLGIRQPVPGQPRDLALLSRQLDSGFDGALAGGHPGRLQRGTRGRRGPRAASGWEALTPTEIKIAALVARGDSTSDIAKGIFLSRRTVQTYISRILSKLGAKGRVEIVREALRHGVSP
jgi:DNA-binding CsgD family transcriptional regulator